MALNIKNGEVESIAAELSKITGQSMTGAVLIALREYREKIARSASRKRKMRDVLDFLEEEVWSGSGAKPEHKRVKLSEDELLGFGKSGA